MNDSTETGTPVYQCEKTRVVRQRFGLTTIATDAVDAVRRMNNHIDLSGEKGWQTVGEIPDFESIELSAARYQYCLGRGEFPQQWRQFSPTQGIPYWVWPDEEMRFDSANAAIDAAMLANLTVGLPDSSDGAALNAGVSVAELIEALEGAQKALRQALPFLPADREAVYCGEWLDSIKETLAKVVKS